MSDNGAKLAFGGAAAAAPKVKAVEAAADNDLEPLAVRQNFNEIWIWRDDVIGYWTLGLGTCLKAATLYMPLHAPTPMPGG